MRGLERLGATPVFVTAYRRHPPPVFLYGAATSCHDFLIAMDGYPVHSINDVQQAIATVRQSTCQTARFTFTHDDVRTNLTAEGVPQLYFYQLNHNRNHLDEIRSPPLPTARKLTRRTLAGTADWPEWEASEL